MLNGNDLEALSEVRKAIESDRPISMTSYGLSMTWMGGVRTWAEMPGDMFA
jgi:hypothetical protein